jgi:hypothetical protein
MKNSSFHFLWAYSQVNTTYSACFGTNPLGSFFPYLPFLNLYSKCT